MSFSEIAAPDQPGAAGLAASIDRIGESLRLAKAAYPESDAERWGLSAVQVSRCAKIAAGHLAEARRAFAKMVAEIQASESQPPPSAASAAPADGDAVEVTTIAVCDQPHRKRGKGRQ